MSREPFRPALRASLLFVCAALALQAQTVTWTGLSPSGDYNTYPENWLGNTLPLNNGTEEFIFGPAARSTIYFINNVDARKISIVGNSRPYDIDDDNDLTIRAGGLVYAPAVPVRSILGSYYVNLVGDQTWDIQSGELGFYYYISGTGRMTKIGAGTLDMADSYLWTGGVTLNAGQLAIRNNYTSWTLGSGNLIIGPPPGGLTPPPTIVSRSSNGYEYTNVLTNAIELNGILATHNEVELNLTGAITLNANTTIMAKGNGLIIDGAIVDGPAATPPATAPARKLTIDSNAAVILSGTNTYSGGTHVQNGALIFANVGSLPALPTTNALTASTTGYIGFGDDGTTNSGASLTNPQGLFLDRFNKASTFGTIGFDTDPDLAATIYTGAINLTGFAPSARLGSFTHAILSGTITPQGTAYRFGGGGGFLQVNSQLTDQTGPTAARSLVLDSPAATPLTLRLTYTGNNYTGGTTVSNSALIFGTSPTTGTFPTPGTRDVTINAGGYVGFEFWDDLGDTSFVAQSLAKISTTSVGTVGYDNYSLLTVPIDLSLFTNALYLGTSTKGVSGPGLTISGTITPAGGANAPYRFAGYKGGALMVESTLTDISPTVARAVHIGDPTSPATFGDVFSETYSTVALTGNNSGLTGPIMLYGGQLVVGQLTTDGTIGTTPTHALGSGTIEVVGMTLPPEWQHDDEPPAPQLSTIADGTIIPNNVNLNADLNIAESSNFTLAGKISGPEELYLEGGTSSLYRTTLTLTNDTNNFTGGIYLSGYSRLDVAANHATGTGPLGFGYSSSAEVYFKTLAPVIGGLMSKEYNDNATLYAEQTNTVLTINQNFDSKFSGYFRSNGPYPADNFRIVKTGTGTLRLDQGGMNFYHGTVENSLGPTEGPHPEVSLQIKQGTLVIGNNFYMQETSPTTIWVNGGTLALDRDPTYYYNYINNPIVVDSNGRLAGNGAFNSSIKIGAGAILAPGHANQDPTGFLAIDHLELNSGGIYEWQIQDPSLMGQAGRDLVKVGLDDYATTLVINATADDPLTTTTDERFTLKVISLTAAGTPGLLSGFDPAIGYSWMLINYDAMAASPNGFSSSKFNLDTTGFANSLAYDARGKGIFYLTDTGNSIMLNFAPIPEPSTYALLALGLGLLGLTAWRKRRAS